MIWGVCVLCVCALIRAQPKLLEGIFEKSAAVRDLAAVLPPSDNIYRYTQDHQEKASSRRKIGRARGILRRNGADQVVREKRAPLGGGVARRTSDDPKPSSDI